MNLKLFFVSLLYILYHWTENCNSETITYLNVERPVVTGYDKQYAESVNVTSRRISRQDPRHYLGISVETLVTFNNQMGINFYFNEFVANRYYRPSFIELHFKFCDFLEKDSFIGIVMKRALGNKSCPFPPGEYHMRNMYIPAVPKNFPFTKGRVVVNVTHVSGGATKQIGNGYIDIEMKVRKYSSKQNSSGNKN